MTALRTTCRGFLVCLALAALAPTARADLADLWPWSKLETDNPRISENAEMLEAHGLSPTPRPALEPPRKSSPFQACGNGMGLGLAGIGVIGVGMRFTRGKRD